MDKIYSTTIKHPLFFKEVYLGHPNPQLEFSVLDLLFQAMLMQILQNQDHPCLALVTRLLNLMRVILEKMMVQLKLKIYINFINNNNNHNNYYIFLYCINHISIFIGQDEQKPEDDEPNQIVMKYNYTSNTEQLVKVNVEKFRKNTNDILEKGSVAIEKTKTGESYYLVYRNAIQQSLYTGQFIKGFSEIKPLGQKAENLIIKAISRKEKQDSKQGEQGENDEKKSISVDTLKIMFTTKEGSEEFKAEFAKIFQ